ncbi:MAG TPA: PRC-barrel domain-containing protein [Acidimicrobiales bacterium]|jgi:uncharacterized protein YrrD|nr:PRC-barrel domain-containing protein [Acidimicrobiales bacterium]
MRLGDTIGTSVVARDTAETIGQVHGAVVDVASRQIVALQVGKGHKARLADWASITGVGPDAAVVDGEASLRSAHGEREERSVKGDIALLGGRVLTDHGDVLGALDDIEFDEQTGRIDTLVCADAFIPADRLLAVGSYAVVVAAEDSSGSAGASDDGERPAGG